MTFTRTAVAAILTLALSVPFVSMAQSAPYSTLVVHTQMAAGVSAPAIAPIVAVHATAPSLTGIIAANNAPSEVDFASNFNGDVHTVYFTPGSYSVTAGADTNYYYSYSPDCSGFTPSTGASRSCTITLSTTPPQTVQPCSAPYYGTNGCVAPIVPYQGGTGQSTLSCSPTYQTVGANQPATFTAVGGSGSYSWTTTDRTSLNVSSSYTTVFQTIGLQTVMVSSGVQTASCTVNVVAGAVGSAVSYPGNTPSVIANYIPALLPNTGFGPVDSAALAVALTLLIAAGVAFYPYVRKAFTVALG